MNQIFNMILRLFIHKGINKGFDYMSKRKRTPGPETEAEKQARLQGQKTGKNGEQMLRLGRRFTRF